MLIRSQNKEVIINLENLISVRIGGYSGDSIVVFTECEALEIGKYSNTEKTIKVLDMIEEAYARCESVKVLSSGIMFEVTERIRNQEKAEKTIDKIYRTRYISGNKSHAIFFLGGGFEDG